MQYFFSQEGKRLNKHCQIVSAMLVNCQKWCESGQIKHTGEHFWSQYTWSKSILKWNKFYASIYVIEQFLSLYVDPR